MKTFILEDLRKFNPCYGPIKYLEEDKLKEMIFAGVKTGDTK
jgi:hypothetical protein